MSGFATITIPSRDANGVLIQEGDRAPVIAHVVSTLCKAFGGVTAYQANGAWVSEAGTVMTESVTVCSAYSARDEDAAWPILETLADYVKRELNQESVIISFTPATARFI